MAVSKSWLSMPDDSQFSLANIPFGVVSQLLNDEKHAAIAIGDHILDLHYFVLYDGFKELRELGPAQAATFSQPTLNAFAALGQPVHSLVRRYLQHVFAEATPFPTVLRDNAAAQRACLFHMSQVSLHLPMHIAGYTDFFAGRNHAYNCGCIFRDPAKALQPNYLHVPVGYNSRASTVVVSGTDVRRPLGQSLSSAMATEPQFGPCRRLDIELELGALLCKSNTMSQPIDVNEAEQFIFGYVLMNDWSARDIQAWEAVPLGPFNSKTFATSISPWVILKEALEPFRVPAMLNEIKLQPYLQEHQKSNVYSIELEGSLTTNTSASAVITRTNSRHLVFSFPQMLAHHTIGGCRMDVGDLIGSGTISGTEKGSLGSLLENSNGGREESEYAVGVKRTFLEDGDTVTLRGWCGDITTGIVGFGECKGTILPSPSFSPTFLQT